MLTAPARCWEPDRKLVFHDRLRGWMLLSFDAGPSCGWLYVADPAGGWHCLRPAKDDDLRRLATMLFDRYLLMRGT